MSKPWYAFFKRAAAFVDVSALIALLIGMGGLPNLAVSATSTARPVEAGSAAPVLPSNLPERSILLSIRSGQTLKVGDTVAYTLEGGDSATESRWIVDSRVSGLKVGFLFRDGKLFTPLSSGNLSLAAIPVIDENQNVVAKTKPITIEIGSNFSEKELASGQPPKPEAALGPVGLPFPAWIQSTIAYTGLAVVLLGIYFIVRFLRRKAAAALKKILPKKPYDQASLDRIDSLLKEGFLEKGQFKPFYFGISEVLKFYLGRRFEVDAQESTTSELISLLRDRKGVPALDEDFIRKLETLFSALDPVKFANAIPTIAEAKEVQRVAREMIVSTRKVEAEPILKEAR